MIYCIVPAELAAKLHERLREHFAGDLDVEVIVERRHRERRGAERRRSEGESPASTGERRLIQGLGGRRVGERRARAVRAKPPGGLPRWARRYASRLLFVERREPSTQRAEDLDTARLVTRIQAGDEEEGFAELYLRFFDRVYGYLRSLLRDTYAAEDIAQQTFMRALEALPRYERRKQPFRAWLFTIARNEALMHVRKQERVEVTDPAVLDRVREAAAELSEVEPDSPGDPASLFRNGELSRELERLTADQRQVIVLRFAFELSVAEAAEVMSRSEQAVRALQHRALRELERRMSAREPDSAEAEDRAPSAEEAGDRDAKPAKPPAREPKQRKRDPMRIRFRPAPVTRERRFSNMGYGRPPGFNRQSENRYR